MKKIITIGILCIAMATMVACTNKSENDKVPETDQAPSQESLPVEPTQEPTQEPVQEPTQEPTSVGETDTITTDSNEAEPLIEGTENTLEKYVGFIGMSRDEIIEVVGEEPSTIDEGGLEFEKAGIRVWFENDGKAVNQVFTQNKDVDFKGAKIGDKIEQFETAFGAPVLEATSSTYSNFDYEGLVLHVEYDSSSEKVYAVSLLKELQ